MVKAFWDASAVVPLCVVEAISVRVELLAEQYRQVVWWATVVEVHSALARCMRAGEYTALERVAALDRLDRMQSRWREIGPENPIREHSVTLLSKHPLRAADSLQLAAALHWCRYRPQRRVILSGDRRLCDAARSEGFQVVELY